MTWSIRRLILRVAFPFVKWWGSQFAPYSKKKVSVDEALTIASMIQPGDVLVSHTEGEFSNILISGYAKHAAMFVDREPTDRGGTIVEATGKGVHSTCLLEFVLRKDWIAVLRPTFANDEERYKAALFVRGLCGKPYDFFFEPGDIAFYCAEAIQFAYDRVLAPRPSPFTTRRTLGVDTVTPSDFYESVGAGKMKLIFETNRSRE